MCIQHFLVVLGVLDMCHLLLKPKSKEILKMFCSHSLSKQWFTCEWKWAFCDSGNIHTRKLCRWNHTYFWSCLAEIQIKFHVWTLKILETFALMTASAIVATILFSSTTIIKVFFINHGKSDFLGKIWLQPDTRLTQSKS